MTVCELYKQLCELIPPALSCDWDNDGDMCMPIPEREVRRVLIALDITGEVVKAAIEGDYDLILSHHPLLFHGLKHLVAGEMTAHKCIDLCRAGISAYSFHTRLDAVNGGVNDTLAALLDVEDAVPFGDDSIGRIGTLKNEMTAEEFARLVAERLDAPAVTLSDAGRSVRRVAVLGGGGGDFMRAALSAGADTYVTGDAGFHHIVDAPQLGINLIVAGHHHTEHPVCERLADMIRSLIPEASVTVMNSYTAKTITKA
ncbi:MAG: Nif3-like dinuclear metal center hexameric protein [Clostridia bacterium]|nr:Nif3-like dinuclear metal center hexameric protein [Clostridia bacterium]